ncbi:flagellar motor protein MotB [Phenylobacterium sp.]|uniref:flagellar motor protein MotB n=1 Tax=Phenylobacterium sp. TaxID=1871053 RepID=UPI00286B2AC5|nr:flagellar motor protein MotB [Phenylobacterium sp.]
MSVGDQPIIIIKRIKKVAAGHHGGAWKVAYADFVTAMMAFFLLMWLINTTSPEQKRGIADYFAPASVSETTSGSGGILAGTALGKEGAKQNGSMSIIQDASPDSRHPDDGKSTDGAKAKSPEQATTSDLREALQKREEAAFASAAQSLRQALQDMPELAELSKNIIIDQTPEGLRIQLVDQEGRSMFNTGTAAPNDRAKLLLRAIAKIINKLPNRISIYGHTSASAGPGGKADGDWTLSATRADSSRRVLQGAGVDPDRVYQVSGKATSEPLYPDDPTLPGNRRIAIVLLREAPVLPPDAG